MSTATPYIVETLRDELNRLPLGNTICETTLEGLNSQVWHITHGLQSTLDAEKIVEMFCQETKNFFQFDSLSYQNQEAALEFNLGRHTKHTCQYNLCIAEEKLGKVCVSRKTRFSEQELEVFEKLLSLLLYPLRNALLYRQALAAATKDPMTGLDNRRSMDEHISHEASLAQRYDRALSMLVLDIDHFKRINDNYGHKAGDCLIKALADIMTHTARASDYTFRYGGEEFVMLLPNTDNRGAQLLAERIRQSVEATECICHGIAMHMTISLGVASLKDDEAAENLFLRADAALYQAKHNGRNQSCVAE